MQGIQIMPRLGERDFIQCNKKIHAKMLKYGKITMCFIFKGHLDELTQIYLIPPKNYTILKLNRMNKTYR